MNLKKLFKMPANRFPWPKEKRPIRVLAANMWAVFNFGNPNERYQRFLQRGRPRLKSLIESLLIHDEIIIPTQDYLSLTILVGVLGERTVIELLDSESLKFLRVNGFLAYVGNGGGIRESNFVPEQGQPNPPSCAPVDQAISWALGGLSPKPTDSKLPALAIRATQEVSLDHQLVEAIRHETYMDVLQSDYLRAAFHLRNTDMDRLHGIGPNGVRIYGGPDDDSWSPDEINVILSLAVTNLEFRLAQMTGCIDSSTASPVGHSIKAKAQRLSPASVALERFTQLRQITGVPDLGEGVLEKIVPLDRLIKLRNSRQAKQFRQWFHTKCQGDVATIGREYAKLVGEVPIIASLPSRIIRFVVTTGIGFANPGVGIGASVLDAFVVDRVLRRPSPKFFIEDLRQIHANMTTLGT